jgi:hypothetical protein
VAVVESWLLPILIACVLSFTSARQFLASQRVSQVAPHSLLGPERDGKVAPSCCVQDWGEMQSREENRLLVRSGPEKDRGQLRRGDWPTLHWFEHAEPEGMPDRIRRQREDLVAFRHSIGDVAALEGACSQRPAKQALAADENCNLHYCRVHPAGWPLE